MKENIILFASSRNDGNTKKAIDLVSSEIDFQSIINLSEKNISYYDYENKNQDDNFLKIADEVVKYKNIFFCFPIYWYSMPAQMKVFFDRLTDLITIHKDLGRALKNRKCFVITTGTDVLAPQCAIEPIIKTCEYLDIIYCDSYYYYAGKDKKILENNQTNLKKFTSNHQLLTSN